MGDDRLFVSLLGAAGRPVAVPRGGSIAIGRGRDCELCIDDPLVSRRHALVHGGEPPTFEALGTKNPSILLRAPLGQQLAPARRIALAIGDVLKIGSRLVGVHHGGAAFSNMVRDRAAFEAIVAEACSQSTGPADVLAVIRVQLAPATGADLSQASLFSLLGAAQHVICSVLGAHDLSMLVREDRSAIEREAQHLASQLSELGMQGEVGLAIYPRDGTTPAALLGAASASVETLRGLNAATPIAGVPSPLRPPRAPMTSFVGRDSELDRVKTRLASGARVVTIVGPPGIGKSRLAMRHAELCSTARVVRCDLATATDVGGIVAAIAEGLGCGVGAERIARALAAHKDVLVIVDNCEQACRLLPDLLVRWIAHADGARFLVTSRQPLGVAGEQVLELGPLAIPADDDDLDCDAVRLFCDRSRGLLDGFAPDPQVLALVRLLDGIPLALELAAGCLDVFSPTDLLARVPRHFEELVDRESPVGTRHHSLAETFTTAWRVLAPHEQAMLRACVVFEGGFSLEAAEAVADEAMAGGSVAQTIAALRRTSWIRGLEGGDGRRRFGWLGCLRAYVEATFSTPNERADVAGRHARYFATLARRANDPDTRSIQRTRELEVDLENLLVGHDHALRAVPPAIDDALALVIALEPPLVAGGRVDELVARIAATIASASRAPHDPSLALQARILRAANQHQQGHSDTARQDLLAIVELARERGDRAREGTALAVLARVLAATDPARALGAFEAALVCLREAGDVRALARALIDLADARRSLGDTAGARVLFEEARRSAEQTGDAVVQMTAAAGLGQLMFALGDLVTGEQLLRTAIEHAAAISDARVEARASLVLASLLQESGRHQEAEAYYLRTHDMFERLEDRVSSARAIAGFGTLLHEQGQLAAAQGRYEAAIAELRRVPVPGFIAVLKGALGAVLADQDETETAARVFGDPGMASDLRHERLDELARAHLDLAAARKAERDGDHELGGKLRGLAAHALSQAPVGGGASVRCARRLLARGLMPAPPRPAPVAGRLSVARGARSLVLPSGERIDLSRNASLRLIVQALASRRRDGNRSGLPTDELLACGWPGERVDPFAGSARVRVALSRLRSLGLRDLLVRADDGYVLAPDLFVEIEGDA